MTTTHRIVCSWVIGTDPGCDLVMDEPTVSARHCRLTAHEAGFTLEDLGSTNGTYVDGERLLPRQPRPVSPGQSVVLGGAALIWPDPAASAATAAAGVISIGRSPDSDVVVDYPVVSWHHARIVQEDGAAVLEDLGSSNGTAINPDYSRVSVIR